MKFFKWKIFTITGIVCLLPILLGLTLWNKLPDTMAIHFNIYGKADGFASKEVVVFLLPVMMAVLQAICCVINDVNSFKYGERVKFETVTKWIIPFLSVLLQIITLGIGLGWDLDIRKVVSLIIGIMFLVIGNYLPKFDRVKNSNISIEKARKINRFIGYETVIMGIVFLITIFLPPVFSIISLLLLIPYTIVSIIYSIIVCRK